jgi:hypothetical protein
VVQFRCESFGYSINDVQTSRDGFVAITAELTGDGSVEASIAVRPHGTCAGRISASDAHIACTVPNERSFESALKQRSADMGAIFKDPKA